MNLVTRLATNLLSKVNNPTGAWNIVKWQSGRPYLPARNYQQLVKKYNSWVYACSNKNSTNCAQVPLRLYATKPSSKTKALFPTRKLQRSTLNYLRKSPSAAKFIASGVEVEEVLQHPFLDLLHNVNEFMNGFDLMEVSYLSQELTGNAYWHITKNEVTGLPLEIWPLFPQYMKIIPSKETFIDHYEYAVTNLEKHLVPPEEMIHFKYVSPTNAFYGEGPLQAAVVAADLGVSMNVYEASLMINRGQPDWALVLPEESGDPDDDAKKRMYSEWHKRFGGVKKSGKMAILHGGADLKQISLSPKEMAFLKGRKAVLEEIAAIFGVPLSKLTTENVNRANAEAGDYSYMKDTILPRLRKFEQKLNEQLLPMYDDRLFCAYDNPVPEDKEFRLKQIESLLKTGYSVINEQRKIDGLEPVEWGDIPLIPMGVAPLGTQAAALQQEQPKHIESVEQHKAPALPPAEHPTNFINQDFVRALQKYYRRQEAEILKNFDEDAAELVKGVVNGKRYHTKADAGDFISSWFDVEKWRNELSKVEEPFIRFTMFAGGSKALKKLRDDYTFDTLNPKVMNALEKHRFGSITGITDTMSKRLCKSLAEGLAAKETSKELRSRIQNLYDDVAAYDAVRIARTETIWAWNEGAVQGYIQSGVVTYKKWVSSGDDRTCEFCPLMDGKVVGVEGNYFDKGGVPLTGKEGGSLPFVYEDVGHPPLHPHCRCSIIAVVEVV